jgi:hypothetical protein
VLLLLNSLGSLLLAHVNYVLSLVNQRLYLINLINQLKKTGLSAEAREVVFYSLIISRLLHALPALAGVLSCADVVRLIALMPYFANRLDVVS